MAVYVTTNSNNEATGCGCTVGFGGVIAAMLSYSVHHSILWGLLHAVCGWFYVIYWLCVYLR